MRARILGGAAAVAAAFAVVTPALGGGPSVRVKDNAFKPDRQGSMVAGDLKVTWFWADGITRKHNVREDRKLFYSGTPTKDPNAIFRGDLSAGTYHYYCEVHGSKNGGMDGVAWARPFANHVMSDQFDVHWASNNNTGDQYDVRFRVGRKDWKPAKVNTTDEFDTFGDGDDPVNVVAGKRYRFQARTEVSANPKRRSGWSPSVSINP